MNNNQNKKQCYVFSPSTVESALKEWLSVMITMDPKKEESFKITEVALPWLLKHIVKDSSIYMFTLNDLEEAIELWKDLQVAHYPTQEKRINETCDLLMHFFKSDIVREHKMVINS